MEESIFCRSTRIWWGVGRRVPGAEAPFSWRPVLPWRPQGESLGLRVRAYLGSKKDRSKQVGFEGGDKWQSRQDEFMEPAVVSKKEIHPGFSCDCEVEGIE